MTDFGFLSVETVLEVSAPIPKPFSFKKEDWPEWISHFEQYRKTTKLDSADEKLQVNALISHMGPQCALFLDTSLHRSEDSFATYEDLVRSIDEYFQRKINVIFERAKFNMRVQKETESAETYICVVSKMAKSCAYGDLESELIRDRLVVGIKDRKCSEALQMEEHLTLEKAKSIIVQAENIKKTKTLNIQKTETRKRGAGGAGGGTGSGGSEDCCCCTRCGAKPSHSASVCPAKETKCTKCANKGHYAKCCQTAGNQKTGGGAGSGSTSTGGGSGGGERARSRTSSLHNNKDESFEFL